MELPKDGIYFDISHADYHRMPAVNASLLKTVRQASPLHARYEQLNPKESTPAMEFGTAVHTAVLEPDKFAAEMACAPEGLDRRRKADKAIWEAFVIESAGKQIVSATDMQRIEAIVASVKENDRVMQFIDAEGANEATLIWTDSSTGLRCKAKFDRICTWQKWNCVLDLKTINGYATEEKIQRAIGEYMYDLGAAWYLRGAEALAPMDRRFFWIFVESGPPFQARVVEPTAPMLEEGRLKAEKALRQWAECVKSGHFTGWGNDIIGVSLKPWHQMSNEELDAELDQ